MSTEDTAAEAIITDEELELDLTPDGSETEDELKQKLANAEKAKKQILARARKAEAEAKSLKEAVSPPPAPAPTTDDEVLDLRFEGYNKEEVKFILANGGRKALEDPNSLVSLALKTRKEQSRAEHETSKITDTSGMSEVERKYTPEQLAAMPITELEKILPKADY